MANQVVNTVASQLPALPAPRPYVVQTIAPAVPNLPSVNLPQLPTVNVPLPAVGELVPAPGGRVPTPGTPVPTPDELPAGQPPVAGQQPAQRPGVSNYTYDTGVGVPRMSASDIAAAAAFDPSRYSVAAQGTDGAGGAGRGTGTGAGGAPGGYDGASVPVFGQLAGLDGSTLDAESAGRQTGGSSSAPALPALALAAVVALAAVTAALVRTHQASRSSR